MLSSAGSVTHEGRFLSPKPHAETGLPNAMEAGVVIKLFKEDNTTKYWGGEEGKEVECNWAMAERLPLAVLKYMKF